MNIIVTGASSGVGTATCLRFIAGGHTVYGLDILPPANKLAEISETTGKYVHFRCNVADYESLPDIPECHILINNAGVQDTDRDISVNLIGTINCTRKYALINDNIFAVLNQADAAAHTGAHFDEYIAAKGGVLSYTKWTAKQLAEYGATCNSLSCGGVVTESNNNVMNDPASWDAIMQATPLKRWATEQEIAEWIYFITVVNRSMSGQDVLIDNLESLNGQFIWN